MSVTTGTSSDGSNYISPINGPFDTSVTSSRSQSSSLSDGESYDVNDWVNLLTNDIGNRAIVVSEMSLGFLFSDEDFGFAVNETFISNFRGAFLDNHCLISPENFKDDDCTCTFLNRMISTITCFLHSAAPLDLQDIRPLRYFSALRLNEPDHGSAMKRKPDVTLLRLVDDCIIEKGPLLWHDAQGFVEQTRESKVPIRMTETITSKAYLTFCSQPERDFIINLYITPEDFRVILMDHAGSVETNPISFTKGFGTIYFLRTVMGLAFLPDKCLGVDTTIIRRNVRTSSGTKFLDQYKPYESNFPKPSINLLRDKRPLQLLEPLPIAVTTTPAPVGFDQNICSISIDTTVYQVVAILFKSQILVGRLTTLYLVELLNGTRAVLKDSWITTSKLQEATFLEGLTIPFGPDLLQSTILGNTDDLRKHVFTEATINESRQSVAPWFIPLVFISLILPPYGN